MKVISIMVIAVLALVLMAGGAMAATNVASITVGVQSEPLTYSIAGSVEYIISVTGNNGAGGGGPFTLSVTGLPTGAIPSFSPATVSFSGPNVIVTSTLRITTTTTNPAAATIFSVATTSNNEIGSGTLTIGKASPTITWSNPADITYGTALSGTQLNAAASVVGNYVYTPASGTVLNAGSGQNLHVAFTPTDTANYNNAAKDVSINVLKAGQTITFGALSDKTNGDADFLLTATASSGLSVSYSASGPCTIVSGNSVHITGAGSCTITASQGGNANFNAATPVSQTFTVNPRSYDHVHSIISVNQGSEASDTVTTIAPGNFNYNKMKFLWEVGPSLDDVCASSIPIDITGPSVTDTCLYDTGYGSNTDGKVTATEMDGLTVHQSSSKIFTVIVTPEFGKIGPAVSIFLVGAFYIYFRKQTFNK